MKTWAGKNSGYRTHMTWTMLAAVALTTSAGVAEDARVASVKVIMGGIHGPAMKAISDLLKDTGPADDGAWGQIATHAALLNESGHVLMQNNRCPDKVWADAAAALRKSTTDLYTATTKKDLNAAREAQKAMGASCGACHAQHKKAAAPAPPAETKAEAPPAAPAAPAAEAKEARLAGIKDIMAGINGPQCKALGNALKDAGPTEEGWDSVVMHAALLNEAGHILMQDKRCPDKVWKDACTALREGAAKVAEAAKTKNLEEARSGFQSVTGACGACHKAHKKPAT